MSIDSAFGSVAPRYAGLVDRLPDSWGAFFFAQKKRARHDELGEGFGGRALGFMVV